MTWTFEWRRTWDEVFEPSFVVRWNALVARAAVGTVYQRPEVVRAWAETCGVAIGAEPMVGVATSRLGEVLLPLTIVTNRGRFTSRRILESIGQDLYTYGDPLAALASADACDWPEFWAELRQHTGLCHQVLLRSLDARLADATAAPAEGAPVLDLRSASNLEALLARCSANHRGEVHRRCRRLDERGDVTLRIFGRNERTEAASAIEQLLGAYDARRERRPEYPSLDRPGLRGLWRRIAVEGTAAGWAHLAALTVDGRPVAWHLGLFDKGELYWWVPAHDPDWEPLSPGKVLLAKLIEHGMNDGWSRVHFLAGMQPYKMAWRPDVPERRVMRWYSPTVMGKLLARYDRRVALV